MNKDRKKDQFLYLILACLFAAVAVIIMVFPELRQVKISIPTQTQTQTQVELKGESKSLLNQVNAVGEENLEGDFVQLREDAEGL